MQFPIVIGLHRSRFLDAALGLLALSASLMLLFFPQSFWLRLGLLVLIWLVAITSWRAMTPPFHAIHLASSGQLSIQSHDMGDFVPVKLLPGATVHPLLTVFRLNTDDQRTHRVIVTVDSIKDENFRRLRVFLRWRADFGEPEDAA